MASVMNEPPPEDDNNSNGAIFRSRSSSSSSSSIINFFTSTVLDPLRSLTGAQEICTEGRSEARQFVATFESKYGRYDLPPAIYLFMIVWLLLGFIGVLDLFGFGSVANYAHLGGLISGILFAMIYKSFFTMRI